MFYLQVKENLSYPYFFPKKNYVLCQPGAASSY